MKAGSVARVLESNVNLLNSEQVDRNKPVHAQNLKIGCYLAIWDTGAMRTVITQKVVNDLSLCVFGYQKIAGVGATRDATEHYVDVWLPNRVSIEGISVLKGGLPGQIDVLIGMDIITLGDFAITNVGGKTVMSYRFPSMRTIDFVEEEQPSRNAPCPCGSGKKYKHCHGKTT
jgi:hypothetical protein